MTMREFMLEAHFKKWEFTARYHFTPSDMETMSVSELLAFADATDRKRWEEARLGYIETTGTDEVRSAIADTYGAIAPDDVLCFAGAEEGLYCAMHTLLDRADHAIVLVPNYQSIETVPLSICEVSGIALAEDDDWTLDVDALRTLIRPNTKLIAVNFPNNPTGKNVSHEVFNALVSLCRSRGIYLLCDEVYRGIEVDLTKQLPHVADAYERGLSLNVLSKAYGLPGLRVGWVACKDRHVLDRMLRLKHYLSICNAGPSEILATIALKNTEALFSRNRGIVSGNRTILRQFFAERSALFEWYEPDGGCVAFPRYLGGDGVEAFAERLVHEAGIFTLPASIYRSDLLPTPNDRFRVGFGRRNLDEILIILASYLNA